MPDGRLARSPRAFACGVELAMVTTGSLVDERRSSENPRVAPVANLLMTSATFLVASFVARHGRAGG
jgi:hypothetical protein